MYGLLKSLGAPPEAVAAFEDGKISLNHLILLGRIPSEKLRERAAKRILEPTEWDYKMRRPGEALSIRDAKAMIEKDFMVELKGSNFDRKSLTLVAEAGSCETCPKRTGNDRENFPDGRADVCTDPECFRSKVAAQKKLDAEKAQKKGIKAMPAAEAKKATSGYRSSYVDLADKCHDDPQRRTYRQILGDQVKDDIALAHDRDGKAHYVVPRDRVDDVLEGVKPGERQAHPVNGRAEATKQAWQKERELQDACDKAFWNAAYRSIEVRLSGALSGAVTGLSDVRVNGILRQLLTEEFVNADADFIVQAANTVGINDFGEDPEVLEKQLLAITGVQAMALYIISRINGGGYIDLDSPAMKTWAEILRLDVKAIKKEAQASLKEKAKAEKAAAKPAKVTKPSTNGHAKRGVAGPVVQEPVETDPQAKCRHCGCTDSDCRKCIEKTGEPCHWEEPDLCSACLSGANGLVEDEASNDAPDEAADKAAEDAEALGVTYQAMARASVIEKFDNAKNPTSPVPCQAFTLDVRKWCVTGSVHRDGIGIFECVPLYPLSEFAEKFKVPVRLFPKYPETDEDRRNYYFGVKVRVLKDVYVIGPPDEERLLSLARDHAKTNGHAGETKAAKSETPIGRPLPNSTAAETIQAEADTAKDPLVRGRLNRMASDLRGKRDHRFTPLRALDASPKLKRAAQKLEDIEIVTVGDAIDYSLECGTSLEDALNLIPGVGRPSAAELARHIQSLLGEAAEASTTAAVEDGPGGGVAMKIARVFPRVTRATPDDELSFFGPPGLFPPDVDEVHVSVSFTWDKERAEQLAEEWQRVAPVKVGGVGWRSAEFPFGDPGADFIPGRYIKPGYTFTSRGCPRKCYFCSVHLRDPIPRLLPIQDGWNILDDNLLACPRPHVEAVFAMLRRQGREVEFTGGLEARALEDYQVGLLADLKPRPSMFWAYDPGDAYETLENAAKRLWEAGFRKGSHRIRCYVLIGQKGDTFARAEKRLRDMLNLGFTPMAMLWRPEKPEEMRFAPGPEWRPFQRRWARPAIIHSRASSQGTAEAAP